MPALDLGEEWTRRTGPALRVRLLGGAGGRRRARPAWPACRRRSRRGSPRWARSPRPTTACGARASGAVRGYLRDEHRVPAGRGGAGGACASSTARAHALGLIPRLPELRFHGASLKTTRKKVAGRGAADARGGARPAARRRPAGAGRAGRRACAGACTPRRVVTYIIDRNINYTNVCTAQCAFCAFYRDLPVDGGLRALARPSSRRRSRRRSRWAATRSCCRAACTRTSGIEFYEELFRWIKASYPIWIHGLSPAEVQHIAEVSKLTVERGAAAADRRPGSTRSRAAAPRSSSTACASIIGIAKGIDRRVAAR